jgi:hypothetical protein
MARHTEVWQSRLASLFFFLALLLAGILPAHVSPADHERGARSIGPKTEVLP